MTHNLHRLKQYLKTASAHHDGRVPDLEETPMEPASVRHARAELAEAKSMLRTAKKTLNESKRKRMADEVIDHDREIVAIWTDHVTSAKARLKKELER